MCLTNAGLEESLKQCQTYAQHSDKRERRVYLNAKHTCQYHNSSIRQLRAIESSKTRLCGLAFHPPFSGVFSQSNLPTGDLDIDLTPEGTARSIISMEQGSKKMGDAYAVNCLYFFWCILPTILRFRIPCRVMPKNYERSASLLPVTYKHWLYHWF